MKKIGIVLVMVAVLGVVIFNIQKKDEQSPEALVFEKTYALSREYVFLRYQTDAVLVNAEGFENYASWNNEMLALIGRWEQLEKDAVVLEGLAGEMENEKTSFNFVTPALAYSNQEISDVFDNAPAGKKIKTLASFLGVDAKKAFQILKQDQAQVEADAWNEAGDTFQKLETSAVVIKDACKVTGMVGGIIVTGGTAAIASAGTAAQAAVLITGADLALEVGSDAARIGLGNANKVSGVIDSVRVVTEPIASVLAITNISGKFDAVMVGLDQFNSAAQEGKVVGVQLPAYTASKTKNLTPIKVAVLEKNEVEKWLGDQGIKNDGNTAEEIDAFLNEMQKEEKTVAGSQGVTPDADTEATQDAVQKENMSESTGGAVGEWKGTMRYTSSQGAEEEELEFGVGLNADGSVSVSEDQDSFTSWTQEGNVVKLYMTTENGTGYYELVLQGDTLTFVKLAGPNSEGEWQEDFAGEDFFGGKFYTITLLRQ